jgi:hypothetical protein
MIEFRTFPTQKLYEYWLSLPRTGHFPARSSVDPAALIDILPAIHILEWVPPDQLRVRLLGTGRVGRMGRDITGKNYLDLLSEDGRKESVRNIELIFSTPCGLLTLREERYENGDLDTVERLSLPLLHEERGTPHLIGTSAPLVETNIALDRGRRSLDAPIISYRFIDIGAGIPDEPLVLR